MEPEADRPRHWQQPRRLATTPSKRSPLPRTRSLHQRRGQGPGAVFQLQLGGWTQDQPNVGYILAQHDSLPFDPASRTCGVAIRFHPHNGRSLHTYAPGSTIFVDGEPKDSLLKPITKVMIGVAAMTVVAAALLEEAKMPEWLKASRLGNVNFPPWVLACIVIVFMRFRERTKDVMKKFGWTS